MPTAVPPTANFLSSGSAVFIIPHGASTNLRQPETSCANLSGTASCKCVRPIFIMSGYLASSAAKDAASASQEGMSFSSSSVTAAIYIAVG